MIYLGEWNSRSVYQPEYDPETSGRLAKPSRKTICLSCMVRWLWPSVAERQDGMCHQCWKEQYDGMDDIPLERSACYETQ